MIPEPPALTMPSSSRLLSGLRENIRERDAFDRGRAAQVEESQQQLNELAYSVSHDLRAPLRHVNGFAKLLSKSTSAVLSPNDRELLDLIVASASRMDQLIDALLRYSRLGSTNMVIEHVDLARLFEEAIRQFQSRAGERNVVWKLGKLPQVRADVLMLTEAVSQLLENATKFTSGQEHTMIEIDCEPWTEAEFVVFIRDDGIGFDPRFAEKIYGVFQRLHGEGEYEGTGIGLALVQRIMSRHCGRTWAVGKENKGATFYLAFPRDGTECEMN